MAKFYNELTTELKEFILKQKLFFVGTAAQNGTINVSPKGLDSLHILNSNKLIWLNLTGSGNETAAHLRLLNRMTIMFCAFEGKPLILRLYGTSRAYHPRDEEFKNYEGYLSKSLGSRQIIEMTIERVQTSCGFGVPIMEYKEDRDLLAKWTLNKGKEKIQEYWKEKNQFSIDGFDSGIVDI